MKDVQILIVDDSHFFLQVVKEFLKRSGHRILTAKSGAEALEIIGSNKPNVILMDYHMADINGDECCQRIKSDPATKDIPVIMLTSAGNEEDMEQCRAAGCDDYITKPVDKMALLTKVKRHLDIPVREYKRAPICVAATYSHDGERSSGTIFSISEGGLFIKGEGLLEKGTPIIVSFGIPSIAEAIEVDCTVAWNTDERRNLPAGIAPGFGVAFLAADEPVLGAIRKYVSLGDYLL